MWYINMHLFEPTCKMNVGVDDLATLVGPDDGALVELSSDLVFTRALIPGVAADSTFAAVCNPLTLWKKRYDVMAWIHFELYISALNQRFPHHWSPALALSEGSNGGFPLKMTALAFSLTTPVGCLTNNVVASTNKLLYRYRGGVVPSIYRGLA